MRHSQIALIYSKDSEVSAVLKWTNVLQNHSQSWPQWASVQKSKQVDVLEVVLGCGGLKLKVVRVICSLLHFTT